MVTELTGPKGLDLVERADHVAPEERPGRVPVQEQQCGTRPLVDVMHGVPVDVDEAALEREQVVIWVVRS